MSATFVDILQEAVIKQQQGIPFVLATIVEGEAGSPGRTGFKVIAYKDGSFNGTVGGGKMEKLILEKCAEIHKTKQNTLETFALSEDGIGMACGGFAKVFYEYFPAKKRLYIFGAGHTCHSLAPIMLSLGFEIIVIDNREEFANEEKLPWASEIYCQDYSEYVKNFQPEENDAAIIITHGHIYDDVVLDGICKKNPSMTYLGMIGSKVKVKQIVENIKSKNYEGDFISKIYSPIGLNIAKRTTEEIAVAIAAEILAVYNKVNDIKFMSRK